MTLIVAFNLTDSLHPTVAKIVVSAPGSSLNLVLARSDQILVLEHDASLEMPTDQPSSQSTYKP